MRPTGKLHLGNYMGALYNWVRLQHEYDCFFFIADWHALTTDYADPSHLLDNIFEIAVDFLSAGLDPEKCTIFVQSHVPQHAELHLLFSMFTPLSWLERVPTYKDQQEQLREKDLATYGFLGYPLLQSADILVYQPSFVPVGQDQVAHVELTREIARKFNHLYSPRRVVPGVQNVAPGSPLQIELDPERLILPEPEVLLTPSPKLPGIDGRKMSKSYGNSILLSEHPAMVEAKISQMSNGGQRNPQTRPGDPDICPVGDMHAIFSDEQVNGFIRKGCKEASILCMECKALAASSISLVLHPIRERRANLEKDPDQVWQILARGAESAAKRAEETMVQVRNVTGLSRTARPIPASRFLSARGLVYDQPHPLEDKRSWWGIDRSFLQRNLVQFWRQSLLPNEIRLRDDDDGIPVAGKAKRVLVLAAREEPDGWWELRSRVRTYEVMVLLCWDKDYKLRDFVVPQLFFVTPWTKQKKMYKKDEMVFSVKQVGNAFFLVLPGSEPIDITSCRGQYQPLT